MKSASRISSISRHTLAKSGLLGKLGRIAKRTEDRRGKPPTRKGAGHASR